MRYWQKELLSRQSQKVVKWKKLLVRCERYFNEIATALFTPKPSEDSCTRPRSFFLRKEIITEHVLPIRWKWHRFPEPFLALGLNEDLTEAIALGHDLEHTPFGHNGEAVLNEIHPGGFHHNEQSIRVVDRLEKRHGRRGLNLTWEVRDGILGHTGNHIPGTLEGQVVRISDRIAYINHDIDDALRSGVISKDQLPKDCIGHLGTDHRTRIDTLVKDMITASDDKREIHQSEDTAYYMNRLRQFMFKNVYYNDAVKKASDLEQVEETVRFLYGYYIENWEEMPAEYVEMTREDGVEEMVKDYVAGMTDRYAATLFQEKTKK